MENEEKSQKPAEKAEDSTDSQIPEASLDEVSGGLKGSERFPFGGTLPPVKERPSGILTPLDDN
jgi:hypothetical protein